MAAGDFLATRTDMRPWSMPDHTPAGFTPIGLFLGQGRLPLEIAVASAPGQPSSGTLRDLWNARHGNTPSPLFLVVIHQGPHGFSASVCGPAPPSPTAKAGLSVDQVERIAATALAEPNRHAAVRFLQSVLPEVDSHLVGIRNLGLVATHELEIGVPGRSDWRRSCERGAELLSLRGRPLVEALGFTVEERGTSTYVLRADGIAAAVAIFLQADETPETENVAYGLVSPLSAALAKADTEQLPYVVVTRGPEIRAYAVRPGVGVGRRGRGETFVEANLGILAEHQAGYLTLLFSSGALRPNGTLEQILASSQDFAVDLGGRLRDRVYTVVVPLLARAVARHRQATGDPVGDSEMASLYEQALTILFRLLFIAYAEDKDLLPYRVDGVYQQNALKTVARQLSQLANEDHLAFDPQSTLLWARVRELVRAVDIGRPAWRVPAYNGGLFSSDPSVNAVGANLENLTLSDFEFGPALLALLVDQDDQGIRGPVDFRSLSVREFGTIYEGLLESGLAIAPVSLTLDENGAYVPSNDGETAVVAVGEIYLHNASGARKSTGTYFTKPSAVEHLLVHALEPALDRHLQRLSDLIESNAEAEAADSFFDFRCVDLAMGSAHFLVAAIDRIEARLSSFLAEHRIPGVYAELGRLRASALGMLGDDLAAGVEIETGTLIRRQVARHCVYGVDTNPIAVELARLGVWIHTFVPGLPLSYLAHNFVVGNSLTGVGTVAEAVQALDPTGASDQISLWQASIVAWIGRASHALRRLGRSTDATTAEVVEARADHAAAISAVEPAAALMDMLVAARLGQAQVPVVPDDQSLTASDEVARARVVASELAPLHFPVVFPEVFLRDRPGFDVIIGNPPWDKIRFEEQQFWVSRSPGLNREPAARRQAAIEQLRHERPTDAQDEIAERRQRELLQRLIDAAYQHQGRGAHGHHDFAKVFLERALSLLAPDGRLGLVLPRVALVLGGWRDLRRELINHAVVTTLQARNRRQWLFEIDSRLMIIFLTREPAPGLPSDVAATIWPAITSETDLGSISSESSIGLTRADLDDLSDTLVIPWFNGHGDLPVFEIMRHHSKLGTGDGWIRAVADSSRWDFSGTGPHRRFLGDATASAAWGVLMSRHVDAFRIAVEEPFPRRVIEPSRLVSLGLGVVMTNDQVGYDPAHPALIYRYAARNDDSRTLIAAALPASGYVYSKGYAHGLRISADTSTDRILALLGYVNSFIADWWVRRFVDRHITLPVISNLPLPRWDDEQIRQSSRLAAELVRRGGTEMLAGGRTLPETEELGHLPQTELLTRLERLVMGGFAFDQNHLRAILADFSDDGCPIALRSSLIGPAEAPSLET
jgi:hypothetical protein